MLTVCVAVSADELVPVHGFVLAPPRHGQVLMRLDPVVGMLHAGLYPVRIDGGATVPSPGTEVDALVVRRPKGLVLSGSPVAAERFIAGSRNAFVTHVLGSGDRVPSYTLVDQDGRPFRLDGFAGKVTILSFVFSRCPDRTVCPAISGKFLYLQRHLDPQRFHLVEVTLDPAYDSPAVLHAYARQFDADPRMWSIATGEPSQVKDVIDSFGISSIADDTAYYVHDVRLVVIDGEGIVRDVVTMGDWNPDNVAAVAHAVAGLSSDPLRRFWFATVANVAAFCGGNASIGDTVLLVVTIGLIASITIPILVRISRQIFSDDVPEQQRADQRAGSGSRPSASSPE
jgi:protein SCO1/2